MITIKDASEARKERKENDKRIRELRQKGEWDEDRDELEKKNNQGISKFFTKIMFTDEDGTEKEREVEITLKTQKSKDRPKAKMNKHLNLLEIKDKYLKYVDHKKVREPNGLKLCHYHGQLCCRYFLGDFFNQFVRKLTKPFSKITHPRICINYGVKEMPENDDVYIIREYVVGKNYYHLETFRCMGDRLIGFYKFLLVAEHMHAVEHIFRVIRPEKFIMDYGMKKIKWVDSISRWDLFVENCRINFRFADHCKKYKAMRFTCPELYSPYCKKSQLYTGYLGKYYKYKRGDLYSIACFLWFALMQEYPWHEATTGYEICELHHKNPIGFVNRERLREKIKNDIGMKNRDENERKRWEDLFMEYFDNCFNDKWGDNITVWRERMETDFPHIGEHIQPVDDGGGHLELFDHYYEEGNFFS